MTQARMLQPESQRVKNKFEREQRAWDRLYHRTDYGARGIQWRQRDALILCQKYLPAGGRILDLGCGCGHASIALAQMGYEVVGIDFSTAMIAQAQHNATALAPNAVCDFRCVDFAQDSESLGSYDGQIALGFVEYFDDPVALLGHMHGVLVERGVAIVQIWNSQPLADRLLAPAYDLCRKWVHPVQQLKALAGGTARAVPDTDEKARPPDDPASVTHRRYTPAQVEALAAQAGLDAIDARGSLFFPTTFFGDDDRRAGWDERLQKLAARKFLARQAVNYIIALRKRHV